MNVKLKSVLFWFLSLILMLSLSVYQRMTGPTKPIRGKAEIGGSEINYRLIRTWGEVSDAKVTVSVPDKTINGRFVYKRYKSHDEWDTLNMIREDDLLVAYLPHLPPAGKMMYHVYLSNNQSEVLLNSEPAILRYKGSVPSTVLIPHIIFMFLAMLFSMRTGFEAIFIRKNTYRLSLLTTIFLVAGGLIFGPIVQKYAFDAYWTGWPLGTDLTDNKTAVAFIFWLIAVLVLRKKRKNRIWPIVAAIVLIVIYIIPHSMLGSEIDFTEQEEIQNISSS
jgi:hypothetical protein